MIRLKVGQQFHSVAPRANVANSAIADPQQGFAFLLLSCRSVVVRPSSCLFSRTDHAIPVSQKELAEKIAFGLIWRLTKESCPDPSDGVASKQKNKGCANGLHQLTLPQYPPKAKNNRRIGINF
jgi:hypothetical protein